MSTNDFIRLSLHDTLRAAFATIVAGHVPIIFGGPGVVKTTLARALAPHVGRALGIRGTYPAEVCILSNRSAVDVGGYPVVSEDRTQVNQILVGSLRTMAEQPCFGILDEFTTTPEDVQGPAMRLVQERYAGEQPLHPNTRLIVLANPPEQTPAGVELAAPLVNRVVVLHTQITAAEFGDYLDDAPSAALDVDLPVLSEDARAAAYTALKKHLSPIIRVRPDMLCTEPPAESVTSGVPFASPRAWTMCLQVLSALPTETVDEAGDIVRAIVFGTLGPVVGMSYLNMAAAKRLLPAVDDIVNDPLNAKLPEEATIEHRGKPVEIRDAVFALIPVLLRAAEIDGYATVMYLDRLEVAFGAIGKEVQNAVISRIIHNTCTPNDQGSTWFHQAKWILVRLGERLESGGEEPAAVNATVDEAPVETPPSSGSNGHGAAQAIPTIVHDEDEGEGFDAEAAVS